MNIPVNSFKNFDSGNKEIAKDIGLACKEFGFFAIKDHGISADLIDDTLNFSKEIFNLPLKSKMNYQQCDGAGQRGYTPFGIEKAINADSSDQKEFWHHGRSNWDNKHKIIMPKNEKVDSIKGFNDSLNKLYCELDNLGEKILSCIATFLEIEPDWFNNKINQGNSILRLIHYPPVDNKIRGIRAAPHEDINLITLLLGTQQKGLEVLDRNNQWVPIITNSEVIVCNVGDMLQRLTNHKLKSTTHRVINPINDGKNASRYSMPFFIHLNPSFSIKTLTKCIDKKNPNIYPEEILANDFLKMRLNAINLT